jgi:hypothetical protein
VLCNTQSELHPLEEGKHAAESGMDLKAYAAASGKAQTTLRNKFMAWRVAAESHVGFAGVTDCWRNLAEIHAAPSWLWPALVERAPRARVGALEFSSTTGSKAAAGSPRARGRHC